jgi:hypothetical protein
VTDENDGSLPMAKKPKTHKNVVGKVEKCISFHISNYFKAIEQQ